MGQERFTIFNFHCSWVPEIKNALNTGILPGDYYAQVEAQVEQSTGGAVADVLTLHSGEDRSEEGEGASVVTMAPPRVRHTATLEADLDARRARPIVVRHGGDDRIVALIEVLSPGNKAGRLAFRTFVEKAASAVAFGYHLLLIDLPPPGARDPQGIHGAVWEELGGELYEAPEGLPLTLAS